MSQNTQIYSIEFNYVGDGAVVSRDTVRVSLPALIAINAMARANGGKTSFDGFGAKFRSILTKAVAQSQATAVDDVQIQDVRAIKTT